MYNIDKKYGVPIKNIACPGCGLKYGHHNTKVDLISEECSKCTKEFCHENIDLVAADYFIETILEIKSLY